MRGLGYWLVVMALVVLAVGVWLVPADRLGPRTVPQGPVVAAVEPPATLGNPSLDSLTELTQRPPFAASRRSLGAGTEDQSLILGRYRLSGVVVAPTRRTVILRGPEGSVSVSEGEAIDGWTVETIGAHQIVLVSGTRRQEIPVAPADR